MLHRCSARVKRSGWWFLTKSASLADATPGVTGVLGGMCRGRERPDRPAPGDSYDLRGLRVVLRVRCAAPYDPRDRQRLLRLCAADGCLGRATRDRMRLWNVGTVR